jgi:hypothetical protein
MCFYTREADTLRYRAATRVAYGRFLASRLDRRRLMLRAWTLVRAGAPGPVRDLIGPALARSWAERRRHLAALA